MLTTIIDNFLQYLRTINQNDNGKTESPQLISYAEKITKIDFPKILNHLGGNNKSFFYWEKPDEEYTILGIDSLYDVKSYGSQRTEKSRDSIEKWIDNSLTNLSDLNLKSVPLFMGGMKFSAEGKSDKTIWDDFADSDWFIPKIILLKKKNNFHLVTNIILKNQTEEEIRNTLNNYLDLIVSSTESPTITVKELVEFSNLNEPSAKTKWIEKVNSALDQISQGDYKKIVLSRRVEIQLSDKPALEEKLQNLAAEYPRCYIFAYGRNNSIFFGASPEKLARISNGWVEADALAGSIPRGKSPEEDEKLANELLLSSKNLNEQYAVVDFIKNSFTGFSEEIVYDEKPIIRKLSNIQHLWTPIKAKLKPGHTIFSILKEIHPTPAICGVPWSGALDFIKTTEGYNRGFYAGIVGWFNFDEQGEFAVSIRSGLLKDNKLYAFAGCGIVEGSDPEAEFEETELKLKPILSLFPNEKVYQS